MITNSELFRKLMFAPKALRMKSFQARCGENGERPMPPFPPMPPEKRGEGCPRGEGMPPFGKGPHGPGHGCHGGRRGHHGPSRERLLLFIAAHPEKVWQKDIADEEGINASSVSEMISRLEADGFLVRQSDENDKRAMVLRLTEKGEERAAEIRAEREAMLSELFAKLTDEEKQTLSDLLDKLLK